MVYILHPADTASCLLRIDSGHLKCLQNLVTVKIEKSDDGKSANECITGHYNIDFSDKLLLWKDRETGYNFRNKVSQELAYNFCRSDSLKYSLFSTSSPGPSPRRFSKWLIVGRKPWQRLGHVVQNLQKSWRFLSRDILRRPKQNGSQSCVRNLP